MKTLFIGQNSCNLKSTDSTNSYASELLRQKVQPEGTMIYTFDQQNGRGQRGNTWYSQPNKNATLSYILHPTFLQLEKQFLLNKITCLAVADLMAENLTYSKEISEANKLVQIKWPNDIYVGNKKIAGILIENALRESSIKTSIVGIGININQTEFKDQINATSLALLTNSNYDLMQLIERLCEFMEARYLQLKANKTDAIDTEYLQKLFQLNEWKNYTLNNEIFEGKIIGVSSFGKLQMELRRAEIKEFYLNEIGFVI